MARLQGRRIEDLSARTAYATVWVDPDGSVTEQAYAGPQRFKDASGTWRTIDPDLVTQADGTVVAKSHPLGLTLAGATSAADAAKIEAAGTPAGDPATPAVPLVTLDGADGKPLTVSWRGVLAAPSVAGTQATYADALTDTDLLVDTTRTGFEQFLRLKGRDAVDANGSVTLTLSAPGLRAAAQGDGSVAFTDAASGKVQAVLPAPTMWDATTDPNSGEHTHTAQVGVKVAQSGDDVDVTLTPDAAFLADPATVFPVTVDPTVNVASSFDTFVEQGYNTDESTSTELKLGNNGSGQIARSFLSFPMTSIAGKVVSSATLNLYEFHSWSCTAKSWEIWSTTHADTSTTWTNQPTWGSEYASSTATKGYSSACAAGWTSTDVTSLVQAWSGNGNGTNSIGLRATDESDPYGWKNFYSGNATSLNPNITVTYNSRPSLPTLVAPVNGAATNDTTPALQSKSTDADGNTVKTLYEIWNAAGTTLVASGYSPYVASGATATWSPGTPLAQGSYKWHASSYDGANWWSASGGFTSWRTFTVDTTAPAATSVASTDFPSGTWAGTPDASGAFTGAFTFTSPSSDVKDFQYQIDGGTWTTVATAGGAVTKSLTLKGEGKHTLVAHTRDAAGNVSAAATYTFYAGAGAALSKPGDGDRPARRIALAATSDTAKGYTGVTYQYRRGETDTWQAVPAADVTTTGGSALSAWPVPLTGGAPAALTWNVTDSLTEDGPVDVRALFTDGATTAASLPHTVTVDRNAGTAPAVDVGPVSVNSLTGDATLSATDASGFDLTVTRTASSRRPGLGSSQEGQAAIFGPQWSAGTTAEITDSDWSYIRKTSANSVALVDVDGDPTGFTAKSGGGWKPEPGAEDLTLTGSLTGTFTLKDTDGTTTTFAKVDPAATTWQVTSTFLPTDNSTTQVVSEKVTVGSSVLARPKYVIAPTSAVTQATCAATLSAKGCRVLEYVYATATTATSSVFGDYAGQVQQVRLWATDPGAAAATATAVAQYAYDTSGRLRQEWDPRISPKLITAYDYDSSGRIITLTPAGELPWTLAYAKVGTSPVAGDGMLVSASRATLTPGSAASTNGTATTSVVYDVPLSGSSAPYAMGGTDVAAWGQSDTPSDATAVFPADQVPASHDGTALGAGDYGRATITYTDASGNEVNTASPGGHITTTEYDPYGNTVRELTAGNRELALAGAASAGYGELQQLGIEELSTADRAQQLSTTSVYNTSSVSSDAGTDKDTDPATVGQRELEEYGPLHLVTLASTLSAPAGGTDLPAGTVVPARQHTVTTYDQGRPTDGTATAANQPTTVTVGASVPGYPSDADKRTNTTAYDWAKGLVTQTVTDPGGLNLVKTTSYDSQGRVIKTTLPKSNGTDAGATVTTYWSATGTGTCQGRPEWADLVCSVGPAGAITGGGTNPSQLPTTTTTYDRWGSTATEADTAGGVTRTTTTTYDGAGRTIKVAVTGGAGTAVPDISTTYDQATGKVATTSNGTQTISNSYDALGRQISYTDGAGNTATTWYDQMDRPTKTTDSAPSTTTYTYDTTKDPRGLETSRTDSVAGTFTAAYDADGDLATEALPGGYTLTLGQDETGADTSRTYTRDSDGMTVAEDSASETVQGQQATHASDTGDQTYTYDPAGRLTHTDDTQADTTTHRTYTFDDNTNRTGLTTTVDNPDGTPGTPVSTASTYDSADRLQSVGGTGGIVYDAFGRTTTQATGATIGYYTNDLVHQQTSADGTSRQTWTLDAAQRLASWTTETNTGGTWTQTAAKTNHYGSDTDSPDWTAEDAAGTITRNVQGPGGDLDATTTATTGTVLQLTDLHGDVTVQLPLDSTVAPTALAYDEFGNPENSAPATRYGWLGGKQRSSETVTGATLMGVRLYDPTLGRFLTTDPVPGGSANAYDYCTADPVNCTDLNGQWGFHWRKRFRKALRRAGRFVGRHQDWISWGLGAACSFVTEGWGTPACAAGAGAVTGWVAYRYGTPKRQRHIGGYYAASWRGAVGGYLGYAAGGAKTRIRNGRSAYRFARRWWRGGHGRYTHIWPNF